MLAGARARAVVYHYLLFNSLFLSVCNAGYYRTGGSCALCPGDAIKPAVGDAVNCSSTCDEMLTVANGNHTACGKWKLTQDCSLCKKPF